MIGDSVAMDVAGASAVGMKAVLVRKQDPAVERCCERLEDLLGIIGDG
jgi:FMN phosphatase YigB (HAD superfamily)